VACEESEDVSLLLATEDDDDGLLDVLSSMGACVASSVTVLMAYETAGPAGASGTEVDSLATSSDELD